jgi:hypothetical protein
MEAVTRALSLLQSLHAVKLLAEAAMLRTETKYMLLGMDSFATCLMVRKVVTEGQCKKPDT